MDAIDVTENTIQPNTDGKKPRLSFIPDVDNFIYSSGLGGEEPPNTTARLEVNKYSRDIAKIAEKYEIPIPSELIAIENETVTYLCQTYARFGIDMDPNKMILPHYIPLINRPSYFEEKNRAAGHRGMKDLVPAKDTFGEANYFYFRPIVFIDTKNPVLSAPFIFHELMHANSRRVLGVSFPKGELVFTEDSHEPKLSGFLGAMIIGQPSKIIEEGLVENTTYDYLRSSANPQVKNLYAGYYNHTGFSKNSQQVFDAILNGMNEQIRSEFLEQLFLARVQSRHVDKVDAILQQVFGHDVINKISGTSYTEDDIRNLIDWLNRSRKT